MVRQPPGRSSRGSHVHRLRELGRESKIGMEMETSSMPTHSQLVGKCGAPDCETGGGCEAETDVAPVLPVLEGTFVQGDR